MAWLTTTENREGVALLEEEIKRSSDRAIGIIGGALVEERLTVFLQRNTRDDQGLWKERTHPSGPFGSFAVKIDIAFMFGLISKEARRDMIKIKDIRNEFAHNFNIKDFENPRIKSKSMSIHLVDEYVMDSRVIPSDNRAAAKWMKEQFTSRTFRIGHANYDKTEPKQRFVAACQVFVMALGMFRKDGEQI